MSNNIFIKGNNYLFNKESKTIIKGTSDYESKLNYGVLDKLWYSILGKRVKRPEEYAIIIELNELDFSCCVKYINGFCKVFIQRKSDDTLMEFKIVDRFKFRDFLVLRNNDVVPGDIRVFNQATFETDLYHIDSFCVGIC